MEFIIHRDKLKDGLEKIRNSLSSSAINPILEHYLFSISKNSLTIEASSISISSIWLTNIESDSDFSFTLPGATLNSLINSLDSKDIKFIFKNGIVTLECGKYRWEASSGDFEIYPKIIIPNDLKECILPEDFCTTLKKLYPSMSSDSSKIDLNSLCVEINKLGNNRINLITTDKIRLSTANFFFDGIKEYTQLAIPRITASEIIRLNPSHMMLSNDGKSLYFKEKSTSGETILKSSLLNVKYPDSSAYLNREFSGVDIVVKKQDLTASLKRLKITSERLEKVGLFEIKFKTISVSSIESLSKSKEEIDIKKSNDNFSCTFKIRVDLILDYINQENDENIIFKIINGSFLVFDKNNFRHIIAIDSYSEGENFDKE